MYYKCILQTFFSLSNVHQFTLLYVTGLASYIVIQTNIWVSIPLHVEAASHHENALDLVWNSASYYGGLFFYQILFISELTLHMFTMGLNSVQYNINCVKHIIFKLQCPLGYIFIKYFVLFDYLLIYQFNNLIIK